MSKLYVDIPTKKGKDTGFDEKPLLHIFKNNNAIQLNQLSDGEKMMILLVSDIARRLTIANKTNNTEEIINGKGIVLIDEIETHLHPSWQRKIIPALTQTFPNIQFIVTTHSPQILANVQKESVHIIENAQFVPYAPPTYGKDSNSILWDIFGVKKYPKHTEILFSKFYQALENENKDLATKALTALKKQFGENYPAVNEAQMSYSFTFELGED